MSFSTTSFLLAPSFRQHLLPALTTLFSVLTRKREPLHGLFLAEDSREYTKTYSFAYDVLRAISHLMSDSPKWVTMALETGLIEAMFRIDEPFIIWHEPNEAFRLTTYMTAAMDALAKFLFFPSVLHQFIRSYKKIGKLGLEDLMADESKKEEWYSGTWNKIVPLALSYKRIERQARDMGFPEMCANSGQVGLGFLVLATMKFDKSFLVSLVTIKRRRKLKEETIFSMCRLFCSGILLQGVSKGLSKVQGTLPPTSQDECFFRRVMGDFITSSSEEIVKVISAYRKQSNARHTEGPDPTVQLPIIRIDFRHKSERANDRKPMEVLDPSRLAQMVSGEEFDEILRMWAGESQKAGEDHFIAQGGQKTHTIMFDREYLPGRSPSPDIEDSI
ncbi:hypothetical protein AAF712_010086 [Marasmius tenuissimus]|uniref:Uncharacterized protein n=1 Tax=Marasmius tenuissimus TaxID=585030 RepID=A0ABR2ZN27_9AGAR